MTDKASEQATIDTSDDRSETDSAAVSGRAALWAETLGALADLVAHDVRNALNAVAVNLEVVRGRAERGADASAIAPFATTAALNFESASAAAEALLAFTRTEPRDVDLGQILARLARLVGVGGKRNLTVTDRSEGRAWVSAPADIVRVAVARSVLSAFAVGDSVACEITVDGGIFLNVSVTTRVPPLPDSELIAAAAASGIRFTMRAQSLQLRFPAVDSRATLHVSS